jgi:hypothetical protein
MHRGLTIPQRPARKFLFYLVEGHLIVHNLSSRKGGHLKKVMLVLAFFPVIPGEYLTDITGKNKLI